MNVGDAGPSELELVEAPKSGESAVCSTSERLADVLGPIGAVQQLRLAEAVLTAVDEPVLVLDATLAVLTANPAFAQVTGYDVADMRGKRISTLNSGRQDGGFYETIREKLIESGTWQGEIWHRFLSGEVIPHWVSMHAVTGEDGTAGHVVAAFGDVTQHRGAMNDAGHPDDHDPLTGLAGRRLLRDRVHVALRSAAGARLMMAVLLVDIDQFHRVNDAYGHGVGDQLLIETAERLRQSVRGSNVIGRMRGDRFLVAVGDVDGIEEVNRVARRLADAVAQPLSVKGQRDDVVVTASIGIALYPDDGETAEKLIQNAEYATDQAKQTGRGTYQFFTAGANARARDRRSHENRLKRAVEHEEFAVYYQPKINLRSGRISGVEALVRWPQRDGTVLPPAEFVDLAERSGLIVPLGQWVLSQACHQLAAWHSAGFKDLHMAVNLSPVQITAPDFLAKVMHAVGSAGINAGNLELEITESSVMEYADEAIAALGSLRDLGVRVTADDFGTGYSSLNYLRRFPIDCIKIDRSFVAEIGRDSSGAALPAAVIAMGQSLGKRVTAEGVETPHQVAFLRQHWCDEIQGYIFSRPVTAEEVTNMLVEGRTL